jgi:hypothetical protein
MTMCGRSGSEEDRKKRDMEKTEQSSYMYDKI